MKSILKIPYYLLVISVCLIGLLLLSTLLPIPGNIQVKIVKSGSMEPAIQTGSIVMIKPQTDYFLKDVITFGPDTKNKIPTTHRIVGIEGKGSEQVFITKGDANDAVDSIKTGIKDIHGRIIMSVPYVGYLLDFVKRPLGFILVVGIPAILIILDEIGKIWSEIRRLKWEKKKGQILKRENIVNPLVVIFVLVVPIIGLTMRSISTISYYREKEETFANTLMASAIYEEEVALFENDDSIDEVRLSLESGTETELLDNLNKTMSDDTNPVVPTPTDEVVEGAEPTQVPAEGAGEEVTE